jgi:hypothetical protein
MISSLGQVPCNVLATFSPFTYRYIDYALVDAFSLAAISRKVRSMGVSKIIL